MKYVKNLLLAFVKQESLRGNDVFECEGFARIMSKVMSQTYTVNATEGSYVSYNLPIINGGDKLEDKKTQHLKHPLFIRVFPEHNDVGVRKVWEAGACLAEFLIQFPHFVQG